jgi:hypothetical protein
MTMEAKPKAHLRVRVEMAEAHRIIHVTLRASQLQQVRNAPKGVQVFNALCI